MSKSISWRPFLRRWSRELMASDLAAKVEPPPASPDWLGFEPASTADIKALEARLGVILPPSYKSFLRTTDGWGRTTPFIGRVRPAAEVNWFRVENESWTEAYSDPGADWPDEEYYAYGEDDGAPGYRDEHMPSLLQISDLDDGVYLLNPEAVTPDGEWEAWFFANWVPGAERYPSFAHLMRASYRSFAKLHGIKPAARGLPQLTVPPPDVPRVPAERMRSAQPKAPSLEELIDQMRETAEAKARAKAVRTFFGKLRGRPSATRRPELVPVLTDTFYAATDPDVRSACVAALTELAEDGDAPKPLFDALSDPDPSVVLHGISALHYFPDARSLEPLCRFIESRANALYNENAMSALRNLGDERAVPTLVGVLLDTDNGFDQNIGTAGYALSRCGTRGVDALISALEHADGRVRRAAVVGLDMSGDPRAPALLDRMEKDPDETVASRAKTRMGKPYGET